MTLALMSTMLWADETITVSANSSDISEGLDLKVVAKLFAEAKNLEEFETMLNNPDSAFCNLDLNGDGQVDYLRVVETGEGNKRLIVLQAILAKDIYQDVASIYVEKDESNNVSVQVIGDEYIYGVNYIIEPVYVYRPLIYDWFWCDAWFAWHSPWYWGYWPGWWYTHACWAHDWYWGHCYAWHRHHHCCSFHHAPAPRSGYRDLHSGVTRRDYATAHPDRSFTTRNSGMTNARDIHRGVSSSGVSGRRSAGLERGSAGSRTFDSRHTAATSRTTGTSSRSAGASGRTAGTAPRSASTTSRATGSSNRTTSRSAGTSSRSAGTSSRTVSTSAPTRSSSTSTRTASSSTPTSRSASTSSATTRSVSTSSATPSNSSSYSGSSYSGSSSRSSSSYSGGSSRSSSSYSGGGSRSSGSFSGGGSRGGGGFSGGSGASSRGGGGGGGHRR